MNALLNRIYKILAFCQLVSKVEYKSNKALRANALQCMNALEITEGVYENDTMQPYFWHWAWITEEDTFLKNFNF